MKLRCKLLGHKWGRQYPVFKVGTAKVVGYERMCRRCGAVEVVGKEEKG